MHQLDTLTVAHDGEPRSIEIYHGDLTNMPPAEAVDVLVVSAFPGNYHPLPGTLVRALHDRGVSVAALAHDKAYDLRESFAAWLSAAIVAADPGIQFRRILCFEPDMHHSPPEVVSDIFRSLMPFVDSGQSIETLAMPLIATGNQGFPVADILEPLLDAAVHWLELGLPVRRLKIVEYNQLKAMELKGAFAVLKKRYLDRQIERRPHFMYDLFISYAHKNSSEVNMFVDGLRALRPDLRLFFDHHNLQPGVAWQQELFEALDDCRKVVPLFSPDYLASKFCKEEYNIALFRHRETDGGTLIPVYLYSAPLPNYMRLVQFIDCREGDPARLQAACEQVIARLES